LLSNFGIQSLEHFCLKFWRKFILKRAMWNCVWIRANPRTTSPARRHVGSPYPGRARTQRRRRTQQSEARAVATVLLRLMTRVRGLGQCHAACAHSPVGEPPSAIGRRCTAHRHRLRAHAWVPVGHEGEALPPRWAPEPIKPPASFPRAPEPPAAARH
jgi:hypothetical protein